MVFELPSIERCAEILDRKLKYLVVEKISINISADIEFAAINVGFAGSQIKRVWREGLSILLEFNNGQVFELGGLTSADIVLSSQTVKSKNQQFKVTFTSGLQFLIDWKAGAAVINLNPGLPLVPDVLEKSFTAKYLTDLLSSQKRSVKSVLINQALIRGLSSIYADEILWFAEIHPFSTADQIPVESVSKLYKTIKYVILDAIKSLNGAKLPDLQKILENSLILHEITNNKSPTGYIIKMAKQNDITAYFTDEQQMYCP